MKPLPSSKLRPRAAGPASRHAALAALLVLAACDVAPEKAMPAPAPPPTPTAPEPVAAANAIVPADLPKRIGDAAGPVVVNFWATWCQPCIEEMPELARFYNEYAPRGAAFLSVSVDSPATVKDGKVDDFVRKHRLPFPVHVLTDSDPEAVARALGIEFTAVPVTLVYGPGGKLVHSREGAITRDELARIVEPLL